MNTKHLEISGRKLVVIDNAYDYSFVVNTEHFALESYYKVTGSDYGDGRVSTFTGSYNLCSLYSHDDVNTLGVLTKNEEVKKLVNGRMPVSTKVHLLRPHDICAPHIDGNFETMLYYVNAKWDVVSGGATLFFNPEVTEVMYTSLFVPNRVLWFDGTIPHMGTPPTAASKHPRLVLAMHFEKQ